MDGNEERKGKATGYGYKQLEVTPGQGMAQYGVWANSVGQCRPLNANFHFSLLTPHPSPLIPHSSFTPCILLLSSPSFLLKFGLSVDGLAAFSQDHTLFQVVELLRSILEHLQRPDQISCAQVCKYWSEVALDVLWYTVHDFPAFANLLAPVKKQVDEGEDGLVSYTFEPPGPTTMSWARFESKYCGRVRLLRLQGDPNQEEETETPVNISSLLQEIQHFRLSSPLLPKLHTLGWKRSYAFTESLMFMHDGVKECCMTCADVASVDLPDVLRLFEAIPTRMPYLTAIRIDFSPLQQLVGPLISLLQRLPS
ncbi:hypothetical protein D9758_012975 [Tetrapyrgos nigripes]|uniref:F-box domain-containing protein n=1 Tax=Tetrapyrgos nigripes TaxID=182062 RepID=A0A8H5FND4_9AGAR|nr:hypothetical protein D9758_012975 [Tetrapyrgos nigripes]